MSPTTTPKPAAEKSAQQWYETEFLPWKAKAQAYQTEKQANIAKLRQNAAALQTMVALLLEGQTKRAVMAWNSLGLEPALAEITLSPNGEEIILRSKGGRAEKLLMDELISSLESLLKSKKTGPEEPVLS